jgi:parallel beta-helix repeat protein
MIKSDNYHPAVNIYGRNNTTVNNINLVGAYYRGNGFGIQAINSNNTIIDNIISSEHWRGIYTYGAGNITVKNSTFNHDGIAVVASDVDLNIS